MTRQTFRDAIALRMGLPLPDPLPERCPSCGEPFDLDHALKCSTGAWVRRRHDEVKLAWKRLLQQVSATVLEEPLVPQAVGVSFRRAATTTDPGARADLLATGVLRPTEDVYFDVAVVDTGAASYEPRGAVQVLREKEGKKKAQYEERVAATGAFVPLVGSVYGTLAPEANKILALVVEKIGEERKERIDATRWQRVALQVATIKATSKCLRARSQSLPPEGDQSGEVTDFGAALSDAALQHSD